MRAIVPLLLALAVLTGCGNASSGKGFNPFPKASGSSASTANPVTVGIQAPNQFQTCVSPSIFTDDAGFTAAFTGAVFCPGLQINSTQRSSTARIKVSTAVPANIRLCVVPFYYDAAQGETCFAINGSADVILSTNQYTSAILVPETYINQYKGYLANPGAIPPSRLLFSL